MVEDYPAGVVKVFNEVLGVKTGAAVKTDATGTLQQYLRGLVALAVAGVKVKQDTATNLLATVTPVGWSYSGEKGVGTTVIKASAGQLHMVLIETDGINDVTVQLYDHASIATNPITPAIVVPGTDRYGVIPGIDVTCSNGIVLVLSGTNGVATVIYK